MIGSLVVLALFVWSERRSDHPVIEPSLFQKRSFVVGLSSSRSSSSPRSSPR